MMDEKDFNKAAEYLARKYVKSPDKLRELLKLIEKFGSEGAKRILSEICENSDDISEQDSRIIKEISFYFV